MCTIFETAQFSISSEKSVEIEMQVVNDDDDDRFEVLKNGSVVVVTAGGAGVNVLSWLMLR